MDIELEKENLLKYNKYHSDTIMTMQYNTEGLTRKLEEKLTENKLNTTKIMMQENELVMMAKALDEKEKSIGFLTEKLDQRSAD